MIPFISGCDESTGTAQYGFEKRFKRKMVKIKLVEFFPLLSEVSTWIWPWHSRSFEDQIKDLNENPFFRNGKNRTLYVD